MGYINSALKELDLSNVNPILRIPTKFAIASGGNRLTPIMCVYCAEVVGGDYRDVKDAFLALELIHNGTLVHDDIIDEDLCIGCAKCVKGCASFGNGSLHLQIRHDLCNNCNECSIARLCPSDAISRVPVDEPYQIKGDFLPEEEG